MSEESILILNMLREGKITAEQADALLRAVRQTVPTPPTPPPAPAAPPPPAASIDPATLAAMQNKLSELQTKLGDLQGKLGAAQAARAAGQAASFAGKVLDFMPRPEIDYTKINKTVDEAMRGLNSLKNDALRTARVAARQAADEAKKAARQGRKSVKFDFNFNFGDDSQDPARPENGAGQAQAAETSETGITWSGASSLSLANAYGNVKVVGSDDAAAGAAQATITKTAWSGSESEARVLLQQIFLTSRVENGVCRVEIVAPSDAKDRVTVDYEIHVPRALALAIETTFGDIMAEDVSPLLTTETTSGKTNVRRPAGDQTGDARLQSRSGAVALSGWNALGISLVVETHSGNIEGDSLSSRALHLSTRSGDATLTKTQTVAEVTVESTSGDVSLSGGSVGGRATVKTQSGDIELNDLRAEQWNIETVSGDADVKAITGTLTVKTISGTVDAEGIHSQAVSLGTVSGDAHWAFAAPFSGSLAGTTVSGDLSVSLWTNSDTRIEMNTTSGSLHCNLPLSDQSPDAHRHLTGKLGDGLGSLKLQSVSGDLRIQGEK